ncbi:hypothetical protein GCM10022402_36950 [Salinactinospora qingdaonensis]|uniref:Uncharacterized protein n=1 Tax=Salinactinospora qingdaonensis TaxID=702744 RepID=A0ABP7G4Q6_9ACTN
MGARGGFVVRSCLDRFATSAAQGGDSGRAHRVRPPPAPAALFKRQNLEQQAVETEVGYTHRLGVDQHLSGLHRGDLQLGQVHGDGQVGGDDVGPDRG